MLLENQEQVTQLTHFLNLTKEPVTIDTETSWETSYQDRYLLGISIFSGGESFYIPVGHQASEAYTPTNLIVPSELLEGIETETIYHNAVFDEIVLERAGIELPTGKVYDTWGMSHLIEEEQFHDISVHDLDSVAQRYLGKSATKEKELKKLMKGWGWEQIFPSVMAKYAEQDAVLPDGIYRALKPRFAKFEDYWVRERKVSNVLKKMIMKGLPLNVSKTKELQEQCRIQLSEVIDSIGFDPAKLGDARKRLFGEPSYGLGIEATHTTPTGLAQINDAFLRSCNHPIAGLIKQHNAIKKQLTGYYDSYLKAATEDYPRLHASFKQFGTVTGRWSCAEPNLHQLPRDGEVKKLFLAEEGKVLVEIDYNNIEWRMAAVYSNAKKLIEAFEGGLDMHKITAEALKVTRQAAKIGGFTWLFAGGWKAIVTQIGASETDSKKFIAGMRKQWPEVYAAMNRATEVVERDTLIKVWTGRERHYHNTMRFAYTAFNMLTQGGSFEIVKESMINLDEAGFDIRNCVHDSLWFMMDKSSYKSDIKEAEHIMSDWTKAAFGLTFSVESKVLN